MRTILSTSAVAVGLIFAGAMTANADSTYTVKAGDSSWKISQEYDITINQLEKANNIQGHLILPGQQLTIPTSGSTTTSTSQSQATTSAATTTETSETTSTSSYTGSNLKSYVLSQMASRTGVSAATWNAIITRESNWQPFVRNSSSGAYGLFQNMHISGGSVEAQVDAAVSLYHAQGMQAWAL